MPFMSTLNSTSTPLTAGATFTGEWEQCYHWSMFSVGVNTDLDGTLKMQFSSDKVNLDSSLTYAIEVGVFEPPHKLEIFRAFCRVTFTNDGATTQSYLRLQTLYGAKGVPVSPLNLMVDKDADAAVVRSISDELLISEGLLHGYSITLKFGRNPSISTGTVPEDVWNGGGVYTGFPAVSEKVEVLSSDAADDLTLTGCEKLKIFGLDASGNEQNEEITMDGVTPVDSVGTYSRVNRAYCTQSANGANTAFNIGTITVRHTTTTANVFMVISIGSGQSQLAYYTVPAGRQAFIRGINFLVNKSNTAIMTAALWVRDYGKSPRLVDVFTASNSQDFDDDMFGGIALGARTDVCMRVTASSANTVAVTTHLDIVVIEL